MNKKGESDGSMVIDMANAAACDLWLDERVRRAMQEHNDPDEDSDPPGWFRAWFLYLDQDREARKGPQK